MATNDSKSYLSYLNKSVDQCNNTYHHSINIKPINSDYSPLTEKIETNLTAAKLKNNDSVRITKYKNILSKDHTESSIRLVKLYNQVMIRLCSRR